jgi:hypothetical protein
MNPEELFPENRPQLLGRIQAGYKEAVRCRDLAIFFFHLK